MESVSHGYVCVVNTEAPGSFDEEAWLALDAAVTAASRGDSRVYFHALEPMWKPPINFVVAYQYMQGFLTILIGESCDFYLEEQRIRDLAVRLYPAWSTLTGWHGDHLLWALLVGGRVKVGPARDHDPRLEHYVAAAGLILNDLGRPMSDFRGEFSDLIIRRNPLPAKMVEEHRWVGDRRANDTLWRRSLRRVRRR